MRNINQEEWLELVANDSSAVIIDVRMLEECIEGIIKNAIIIDFLDAPKFKIEIEKLDKDKNYYVYCRSGNRSSRACRLLEGIGVESTYNLIGGMLSWTGIQVIPTKHNFIS
ncbi:rhodanese-like domain-containing protein [Aquimarina hainanensis]|uniref:Rhodanese-like domain-containing protein n=1 Tax=Aquimarina hainanensis TaxID=1578017 RepID=A0ABW5N4A9_9FLAO